MLEMACNFHREWVIVLRCSGVQVRVHMLCVQSPCYICCVPTIIAVVVDHRLSSFQFTSIPAPLQLFLHPLKSTHRIITSCLFLVLSKLTDPTLLADAKLFERIVYFLQVEQERDQIDVVFSMVIASFL